MRSCATLNDGVLFKWLYLMLEKVLLYLMLEVLLYCTIPGVGSTIILYLMLEKVLELVRLTEQ